MVSLNKVIKAILGHATFPSSNLNADAAAAASATFPASPPSPSDFPASAAAAASPGTVSGCPICMLTFRELRTEGRSMVSTRCGHVFCARCLPRALERQAGLEKTRVFLKNPAQWFFFIFFGFFGFFGFFIYLPRRESF
jgi:hypothetical protein